MDTFRLDIVSKKETIYAKIFKFSHPKCRQTPMVIVYSIITQILILVNEKKKYSFTNQISFMDDFRLEFTPF